MVAVKFDLVETLFFISTACYIASMTAYILFLFKPIDSFLTTTKENMEKYGLLFISAGFFIHFGTIIFQSVQIGTIPLNNIEQALSILALAIAGGFKIFKEHFNLSMLGIFVSPVIVFIMVGVVIIPLDTGINSSSVQKFWLFSHLLLLIIGHLVFLLSFGVGILYIFHNKIALTELLTLDMLDFSNYIFLSIGFTMLTFGLITGFIYAKVTWGNFWNWSPGIIWSMGTWIVYSILLYTRLNFDWKGYKSAVVTTVCFGSFVFTFVGLKVFL